MPLSLSATALIGTAIPMCFLKHSARADARSITRTLAAVISVLLAGTALTAVAIAASGRMMHSMGAHTTQNPATSGEVPALVATHQWLNTAPLQADDLRGKAILVNFWTYSCINSLRALPYVRAWSDKYRDRGLVVVGVHTPEFEFEKDIANIRQATSAYDVRYPVAVDSQYATWNAFGNDGWPAFFLLGADGTVRGRMLGEGDYDKSERLIQKLLSEAGGLPVTGEITEVHGEGAQAEPDLADLRASETYVGHAKATNFVSPGGIVRDVPNRYRGARSLPLNHWGLAGAWTVGGEFATLNEASGRITFRFHSRDIHLVMGASSQERPVRFRVNLDGAPPGKNHGVDTDADGWGTVKEPRLYQLIRQTGRVSNRTIEIEFLDPGVRAYVFTFG